MDLSVRSVACQNRGDSAMRERLHANIAIMEPKNGLDEKIALAQREDRALVVKLGFDPTAPDLHLGHAVVLQKLRDFQQAGHRIVVIIGDFTAAIGDPTGRNQLRPPLSKDEIKTNSASYIDQLSKCIDIEQVEIRYNSEWYDDLGFSKVIKLVSKVTVAQIMQRDDFKKRFGSDLPIHLHELLYPILQGYDSIMVNADIEIGGTDQLFNNLMGRSLQESYGYIGQAVITMPLLVGTDGVEKMSKSKNNFIGVSDQPENIYGKVMSIPDDLILSYLDLTTTFTANKRAELQQALTAGNNPMLIKKELAANIVERFYSSEVAVQAAAHFQRTVQKRAPTAADHMPLVLSTLQQKFSQTASVLDICAFAVPKMSRSHIRRLIRGGGVRVNQQKVLDENTSVQLKSNTTLWVGKRDRFTFV